MIQVNLVDANQQDGSILIRNIVLRINNEDYQFWFKPELGMLMDLRPLRKFFHDDKGWAIELVLTGTFYKVGEPENVHTGVYPDGDTWCLDYGFDIGTDDVIADISCHVQAANPTHISMIEAPTNRFFGPQGYLRTNLRAYQQWNQVIAGCKVDNTSPGAPSVYSPVVDTALADYTKLPVIKIDRHSPEFQVYTADLSVGTWGYGQVGLPGLAIEVDTTDTDGYEHYIGEY